MELFKKKVDEFPTPYTVKAAFSEGGPDTKISMLLMGWGNIRHGQVAKGLLFLAVEVAYIVFMITNGFHCLAMLPSLGSVEQTFQEDLKDLLDHNIHRLFMTPSLIFIFGLTVLPLIFMICMAFTNYSRIDNHLVLFDWVGLDNFKTLFDSTSILGSTFWSVLLWTIVWAFFATFTNYIFGMILAIVINRKDTKAKGFWRFCFVLSCAVPSFVSLLIMRTMLQPNGAVNVLLRNIGWIAPDGALPFFTDPLWAKVTVIVINIWVGVPYTLLQLTGVLQNIPGELYEATRVDGANVFQIFTKITLPYMLFVTTPYLIATFTGNVNNFNIIYLLSGGDPVTNLASTAGSTDLLVTWLYKLTIDKQYYNVGAVIGILTFVILAIGSLITYRNSKSYKDEEGF